MAYRKTIVCLANSLKTGGLCIAGREVLPRGFGAWVRPVSARPHEELTYLEYRYPDGSSPRLLDVVGLGLLRPNPYRHQSENHLIDHTVAWVKRGEWPFAAFAGLVERPETLWTNSDRTSSGLLNCLSRDEALQHGESLHLVEAPNFAVCVGRSSTGERSFYGLFAMRGNRYKLSVTDPVVRERFDRHGVGEYRVPEFRRTYVCVSLTKPFEGDGRCHKLIAAVITNPPLAGVR
jgi:hypothetical protein